MLFFIIALFTNNHYNKVDIIFITQLAGGAFISTTGILFYHRFLGQVGSPDHTKQPTTRLFFLLWV
jgi:hypothetical protein